MTLPAPQAARTIAIELARYFERDTELAKRLNDAQDRLRDANDRLWSGLHPDGLAAVYGDHPEFETVQLEAAVDSRSEVLDSSDPLGQLQEVHWAIHRAFVDYQAVGEAAVISPPRSASSSGRSSTRSPPPAGPNTTPATPTCWSSPARPAERGQSAAGADGESSAPPPWRGVELSGKRRCSPTMKHAPATASGSAPAA